MVTKVHMTTMKQGMRTLSGMKFLSSEITKLEPISTKDAAAPHAHRVYDAGGGRYGGAGAENQSEGGVLRDYAVKEYARELRLIALRHLPLPPSLAFPGHIPLS